ncbi:MAG: hypothetical protein ACE5EU_00430 [Paracoccaceae bacterium]
MKKVLGAIAITAVALATTTAVAETAADEQRARLASLWGQDKAASTSRTISSQATFTAPDNARGWHATGPWAGNHRAGRVHPPAGH